jgi:HicA toxin of bacterial toxin-antitoxin,
MLVSIGKIITPQNSYHPIDIIRLSTHADTFAAGRRYIYRKLPETKASFCCNCFSVAKIAEHRHNARTMSQFDKLREALRRCRGTFAYRDFERLLGGLGYQLVTAGKTGGSRRKFMHEITKDMIWLDEPHDGEMKPAMVRRLREHLESKGLI